MRINLHSVSPKTRFGSGIIVIIGIRHARVRNHVERRGQIKRERVTPSIVAQLVDFRRQLLDPLLQSGDLLRLLVIRLQEIVV